MDNLSSHKGPTTRAMIEDVGARLRFLQPYSPNFNPIENAFAKLKAMLRKAAERTVEGLWSSIGRITDTFTPSECQNYLHLKKIAKCRALRFDPLAGQQDTKLVEHDVAVRPNSPLTKSGFGNPRA